MFVAKNGAAFEAMAMEREKHVKFDFLFGGPHAAITRAAGRVEEGNVGGYGRRRRGRPGGAGASMASATTRRGRSSENVGRDALPSSATYGSGVAAAAAGRVIQIRDLCRLRPLPGQLPPRRNSNSNNGCRCAAAAAAAVVAGGAGNINVKGIAQGGRSRIQEILSSTFTSGSTRTWVTVARRLNRTDDGWEICSAGGNNDAVDPKEEAEKAERLKLADHRESFHRRLGA